jgi:hypothetical protein
MMTFNGYILSFSSLGAVVRHRERYRVSLSLSTRRAGRAFMIVAPLAPNVNTVDNVNVNDNDNDNDNSRPGGGAERGGAEPLAAGGGCGSPWRVLPRGGLSES